MPDDLAARAALRLLAPQPRVVGGRERAVERLRIVARVVALAGDGAEREALRRDEVAAPQLGGVEADRARRGVDQALDVEAGLRPPAPR